MGATEGAGAVRRKRQEGYTLVEVLTVVAIVGVVAAIALTNFRRIAEAVRVEDETKRIYVDIAGARSRAVITKRCAFVELTANRVRTFEDTHPGPNGNGVCAPGSDRLLAEDNVSHAVDTAGLGGAGSITFDPDGVTASNGFFRLLSAVNSEYDCVRVEPTRIRMGKYDPNTDACNAK